MIITVVAMREVQVAVHEVASVVTMRNRFVTAAITVLVTRRMCAARVLWGTGAGIGTAYR